MNVVQLEYFISAVENRSYSSASKCLFVNPSTISIAIAKLEKELGLPLFVRTEKGITPTEFGNSFYSKVQHTMFAFNQLERFVESYKSEDAYYDKVIIAVDTCPLRSPAFLVKLINEFAKTKCDTSVLMHEYPNQQCLLALEARHVDAAIVIGKPTARHLDSVGLCSVGVRALVSRQGSFANLSCLAPKDISKAKIAAIGDFGVFYNSIRSLVEKTSATPNFVDLELSYSNINEFIAESDCIVFTVSDSALENDYPNAMLMPLAEYADFTLPVYFAYQKGDRSKGVVRLREHLCAETMQQMLA